MQRSTKSSIIIVSILMVLSGIIYFVSSYMETLDVNSSDVSSQVQTMFFATVGIVYIPLGIWMLKNRLHSRAPYVISILVSIFLIFLYAASRSVNLPVVGIQTDVSVIDLATKTIQVGIIAFSAILLRDLKKHQILHDSQLFANRDWEKRNVS
jgi:cell division protein FtsW (lipid II flippase)